MYIVLHDISSMLLVVGVHCVADCMESGEDPPLDQTVSNTLFHTTQHKNTMHQQVHAFLQLHVYIQHIVITTCIVMRFSIVLAMVGDYVIQSCL